LDLRYSESALNRASGSIIFENYLSLRFQRISKRSEAAKRVAGFQPAVAATLAGNIKRSDRNGDFFAAKERIDRKKPLANNRAFGASNERAKNNISHLPFNNSHE
jgi:hypothetical protein